jgi:hypothetical protein
METHEIEPGDWREENYQLASLQLANVRSVPYNAKENREKYVQYFTGKGEVSWKENLIRIGRA